MPDPTQFGYAFLWDQILKWVVVLQRPAVQSQLLAIAISILGAKLTAKWVWGKFRRRFTPPHYAYRKGQKRSWTGYGAFLLRLMLTPLFDIVAISLFKLWFLLQGWVSGLLWLTAELVWAFFFAALLPGRSLRPVPDRFR